MVKELPQQPVPKLFLMSLAIIITIFIIIDFLIMNNVFTPFLTTQSVFGVFLFEIVFLLYILLIFTNIQIVKRRNKTVWLVLCIISYFAIYIAPIILIIYWSAGKDSVKDDELRNAQLQALKKGKVNVQLHGNMRRLR